MKVLMALFKTESRIYGRVIRNAVTALNKFSDNIAWALPQATLVYY